jgi:hypothetical protein
MMAAELLIPLDALPAMVMRYLAIHAPELVGKECEWSWDATRRGLVIQERILVPEPLIAPSLSIETHEGMKP